MFANSVYGCVLNFVENKPNADYTTAADVEWTGVILDLPPPEASAGFADLASDASKITIPTFRSASRRLWVRLHFCLEAINVSTSVAWTYATIYHNDTPLNRCLIPGPEDVTNHTLTALSFPVIAKQGDYFLVKFQSASDTAIGFEGANKSFFELSVLRVEDP